MDGGITLTPSLGLCLISHGAVSVPYQRLLGAVKRGFTMHTCVNR